MPDESVLAGFAPNRREVVAGLGDGCAFHRLAVCEIWLTGACGATGSWVGAFGREASSFGDVHPADAVADFGRDGDMSHSRVVVGVGCVRDAEAADVRAVGGGDLDTEFAGNTT